MTSLYFTYNGSDLATFGLINCIWQIYAANRFVCWNLENFKPINLNEFLLFRLSRTCHTSQLVIHTEIILESNGCQCLAFSFHLASFLSFNRLMKPIGVAAAIHHTAGKFINNDDFAILDHIVTVSLHHRFCAKCLVENVVQLQIFGVI